MKTAVTHAIEDYLKTIFTELESRKLTSEQWEYARKVIVEEYTLFPTLKDILSVLTQARYKDDKKNFDNYGMEYFRIDGYPWARKVKITPTGELIRLPLPEGATNYKLALPDHLKANEERIDIKQALEEGIISEEFYGAMMQDKSKRGGRFKKIGELIRKEEKEKAELWEDI